MVKHGASGARVVVRSSDVIKMGDERVVAQGKWLARHPSLDAVPRYYRDIGLIDHASRRGYAMEKLSEPPRAVLDGVRVLAGMGNSLKRIWGQPAEIFFNKDVHRDKIFDLANVYLEPYDRRTLGFWFSAIEWPLETTCLTHGDPTYDNVMLRSGDVVLIDPIPASAAIPDMRSVDIGKVLQSAIGYEAMRYGEDERFRVGIDDVRKQFLLNKIDVPMYWCAVHLLRAAPYQEGEVRDKLIRGCVNIVRNFRR